MSITGNKLLFVFIPLGFVLFISGSFSFFLIQHLAKNHLRNRLPLVSGSTALNEWTDSSNLDIVFKVYLFHVANEGEMLTGLRPLLIEKGPFSFRGVRRREVLGWNRNETLITYRTCKTFYFQPTEGDADIDEMVNLINYPLIAMVQKLGALPVNEALTRGVQMALNDSGETPFLRKTARELLVDGFESTTIKLFQPILNKLTQNRVVSYVYGFIPRANNSCGKPMTMSTGKGKVKDIMTIRKWANSSHIDCWIGSYCSDIQGTDGTQYHPFVEKDELLHVFIEDIYRSIELEYDMETKVDTISTLRFKPSKRSLGDQIKCFCEKRRWISDVREDSSFCSYEGLIDLSRCMKTPFVASNPHLFGASPLLAGRVAGLHHKTGIESFLDIDPFSGIVLRADRQGQVNIKVHADQHYSKFDKLPTLVMPIYWFDESGKASDGFTKRLKQRMHKVFASKVASLCVAVLGLVLMLGSVLADYIFDFKSIPAPPAPRVTYTVETY